MNLSDIAPMNTKSAGEMMPTLSICILTLNARDYLQACLRSIQEFLPAQDLPQNLTEGTTSLAYEIIVADNGSNDGTLEMLAAGFPQVRLIRNTRNEGFSKPVNQMLAEARGEIFLLLNPDTLLIEDAFSPLVAWMRANAETGIAIPKVLNADGSFQQQCRRGEARPAEVFGYFLRLGKLFPHSRALNGYLQSWLPEDEIAEVKAVSGSCMLIRRETWEQVGPFDEQFFAYQEDSDYCLRARKAGWKVMYVPLTRIVHYGGEGGSKAQPANSILEWHRSYYLYYRKHFARDYFFLFNGFYYAMMALKLGWALVKNLFRRRG
ncbi:MAG: glycosyltransferase family 2 protein [Anaerolineaceae bacterium]